MASILRPKEISLGDVKYYNADDLRTYDSAYFHGCSRTVRKIIKKKTIDADKYVYATWSKKNGWTKSSNQAKPSNKAKLLFLNDWVTQTIPKMMPDSNESKDAQYEYPEAPDLLHLEDIEKFTDINGNVVDIETRGVRTPTGIYFLAADVSTAFELPSLSKNVYEKTNTDYIKNEHYKIFLCSTHNTKKQLFITYIGMLNVIFKSRNYNTQLNQLVLMNWVQNMAGICQLIYEPNLLSLNKTIGFNGVVYFATCDILNGIKIGFWRSSLESLKKRYTTTYGKNTKILFCRTQNAPKLEKEIHKEFHNHNITNEIFSKDKLEDYLHFIKNTKKLKIYDYDNCTIDEKK